MAIDESNGRLEPLDYNNYIIKNNKSIYIKFIKI